MMITRSLLVVALVTACNGSRKPPPAGTPSGSDGGSSAQLPTTGVRLFTEAEIAGYRKDLNARLDATARRSCPRPLLRGPASAGPAGPDLIAIDAASGALGDCLTSLRALAKATKLGDAVTARQADLVALETRCGAEIEAAVRKAGAHDDACSPFQLGVGVETQGADRPIHIGHLMGLRARRLAEAGDPQRGLWLTLDTIRYVHDLARGRTTLINVMIATATIDLVLDHSAAIIEAAKPSALALDELAAALDVLLASGPSLGDTFQAEHDMMALYYGAALLEPAGWVPPGGWNADMGPPRSTRAVADDDDLTPDPRDEGALMLATSAKLVAIVDAACPATVPMKVCYDGLAKITAAQAVADGETDPAALFAELVGKALSAGARDNATLTEEVRVKIRDQIIGIMMAVAAPAREPYAGKLAAATARLAGFRFDVEVRRTIAATKLCPTAAQLDEPRFAALRAPAALGDALVVTQAAKAIEIAPPAWAKTKRPPWRVACPVR